MDEKIISRHVKRTQKDYSFEFKLSVVSEIEQGKISITAAKEKYGIQSRSTIVNWLKKYGTFDWNKQTPMQIPNPSEKRILELEAKVEVLEKEKHLLEVQADFANKKALFFDMMIGIAEEELGITIKKQNYKRNSTHFKRIEKVNLV